MKFSTRQDIGAPVDAVFGALCQFDFYERAAARRGADVRRRPDPVAPGPGTTWDAGFLMRGKERQITLEVAEVRWPSHLIVTLMSKPYDGTLAVELVRLTRNRTRIFVGFELRPRTLSARVMIKSAKLTKPRLDEKFRARVSEAVADIQRRATADC